MAFWINNFLTKKNLNPMDEGTFESMPYCVRIMLESCCRNYDGKEIKLDDVLKLVDWKNTVKSQQKIVFKPARVMLQDFTAIPIMCDLATVRDTVHSHNGQSIIQRVKPQCLVDMFIDYSFQSEVSINGYGKGSNNKMFGNTCPFHKKECTIPNTIKTAQENEFRKNNEQYKILKWASQTFDNISVFPPGLGLPHHFNVEFMSRFIIESNNQIFPDTVIGIDSNLSLLNGLGILSLGTSFAETESTVLGMSLSLEIGEIVGCRFFGSLSFFVSSTDIVLAIIRCLRDEVAGSKFVEFFGPSVSELSINERMTLANMSGEFGAVVAFFPPDDTLFEYLTPIYGNDKCGKIEKYFCQNRLCRRNCGQNLNFPRVIDVDLSLIQPYCSLRRQRLPMTDVRPQILEFLKENTQNKASVVSASIIHYTNHTVSSVMLAAGLLAKNAVEAGFRVKPSIKCSLMPGNSLCVPYLLLSNTCNYLSTLGFSLIGYGCKDCLINYENLQDSDNEGFLQVNVTSKCNESLKCAGDDVLLVSPLYVVAYALVGDAAFDFELNPIGVHRKTNKNIFLCDLWPTREQVKETIAMGVNRRLYGETRQKIINGSYYWNKIETMRPHQDDFVFCWDRNSSSVQPTPFFQNFDYWDKNAKKLRNVYSARVLLMLGDDVTSGFIAPAGSIPRNSPASQYLSSKGLVPRDYGSYGSHRGSYDVMVRGMFGNSKLDPFLRGKAKLINTNETSCCHVVHYPSLDFLPLYVAAGRYQKSKIPLIVFAGNNFGTGSYRDWAGKGLAGLGVGVVVAGSFPEWLRFDLVSVGIVPLCFEHGMSAETLGLSGNEMFDVLFPFVVEPNCRVKISVDGDMEFAVSLCCLSDLEVTLLDNGGAFKHSLRTILSLD